MVRRTRAGSRSRLRRLDPSLARWAAGDRFPLQALPAARHKKTGLVGQGVTEKPGELFRIQYISRITENISPGLYCDRRRNHMGNQRTKGTCPETQNTPTLHTLITGPYPCQTPFDRY